MADDATEIEAYAKALRERLGSRALPIAIAQMNAASGSARYAWSRIVKALKDDG